MRNESLKQLQTSQSDEAEKTMQHCPDITQSILNFKLLYNELNRDNINTIETIYLPSIEFVDPFHQVTGIEALKDYFNDLYENVESISFDFKPIIQQNCYATLPWDMYLSHPKINSGAENKVRGISLLTFESSGLISKHHDYFDAGQMLYEHIPLVGKIIRLIKGRL
jgi:hypothetical protein